MGKRNPIQELLAKQNRKIPNTKRWDLVKNRLNRISLLPKTLKVINNLNNLEKIKELEGFDLINLYYETVEYYSFDITHEILACIPIGLVSCIECYFRQAYADLINYGAPYKDNASKLKDIKLNIGTVISLEANSVSIGDFVAHLLTTNNLEDINKNVSTLIDDDFLSCLKSCRNKVIRQQSLFDRDEKELNNEMIEVIKQIFELRHIFCHEGDPVLKDLNLQSVPFYLEVTLEFLWMSDYLFDELLSS